MGGRNAAGREGERRGRGIILVILEGSGEGEREGEMERRRDGEKEGWRERRGNSR